MEPLAKQSGLGKADAADVVDGPPIRRLLCGGNVVAMERDYCNGSWRAVHLLTGERCCIPGSSLGKVWGVFEEQGRRYTSGVRLRVPRRQKRQSLGG